MVLAFTGAGISAASGIPTFAEQPDIRDHLSRSYADQHPKEYNAVIEHMQSVCSAASPNDAHLALAEYDIPVITMNVDGLHQRAGSKHVLPIHGTLPNIVLYEDPAPRYEDAHNWVSQLREGDFLLIVGTSYYTTISLQLKKEALAQGADVYEINEDAEHRVRDFLERVDTPPCSFDKFMARDEEGPKTDGVSFLDELERTKKALAAMWFAYENKDDGVPHDFEIQAVAETERILGPWKECMPKYLSSTTHPLK